MSFIKHPEAVRRANRLRKDTSLSSFVNDALVAYTNELERIAYTAAPLSDDERQLALVSAASFVGEDDEDWDAVFPEPA